MSEQLAVRYDPRNIIGTSRIPRRSRVGEIVSRSGAKEEAQGRGHTRGSDTGGQALRRYRDLSSHGAPNVIPAEAFRERIIVTTGILSLGAYSGQPDIYMRLLLSLTRLSVTASIFSVLSHAASAQSQAPTIGIPADSPKTSGPANLLRHDGNEPLSAMKLSPLLTLHLPSGHREVRIWSGNFGEPQYMFRFVIAHAHVTGQQFFYWGTFPPRPGEQPGETVSDHIARDFRGRCGPLKTVHNFTACVARDQPRLDWEQLLHTLEANDLWTLPDPSVFPRDNIITNDGWGFTIELRDGDRYRVYEYSNPEAHPTWPTTPKIVAIRDALYAALPPRKL